jgi:biotin operon repressor
MLYQRSFAIERRLDQTLNLIRAGKHSTPSLAEALMVSIPTASRCITALRARGHDIRSVRGSDGWHYSLIPDNEACSPRRPPEVLGQPMQRHDHETPQHNGQSMPDRVGT